MMTILREACEAKEGCAATVVILEVHLVTVVLANTSLLEGATSAEEVMSAEVAITTMTMMTKEIFAQRS